MLPLTPQWVKPEGENMNHVIETLLSRKSTRAFEKRGIEPDVQAAILKAALRAPTAGNMMLYSIINVTDQAIKDRLADRPRPDGMGLPGRLPALA
jgi:nitroreductase